MNVTPATQSVQPPSFAARQARTTAAITRRLDTITKLESGVTASTTLSADQKTALLGKLTGAATGLTTLRDKVGHDTADGDLRADNSSVYTDFRVYKVLAPQVRGAESITALQSQMAGLSTQVTAGQTAVGAAAPGAATTAAAALLTAAGTQLGGATGALDGQLQSLLARTAADYDSDPTVMDAYRTAIATGTTDVAAATDDVSQFTALHL